MKQGLECLFKRIALNGINIFPKVFEGGFLVEGSADTLNGNSWFISFYKSC
jgi:hypothetical protein